MEGEDTDERAVEGVTAKGGSRRWSLKGVGTSGFLLLLLLLLLCFSLRDRLLTD